jgi:peptide/nickel transport system ATP-binding protein
VSASAIDPLDGGMQTVASVDPVLRVSGLEISRPRRDGSAATIVSGVDLEVGPSETIGIVGESGSGKSMTARALVGVLPRALEADGEVIYNGRQLLGQRERSWRAVRGREIGLIMQDPFTMLNPVLRVGTILDESLLPERRRSLNRAERRAEVVRLLAEVGIRDDAVANRYPFQLSGGMRQRVAIAAALAREPQVLIADEPSTALDVTTQREILTLTKRLQASQSRSMSLILITHDLRVAFAMCDRIYVLYAGSLIETGPAHELEGEPFHPYTQGLLLSEPPADRRVRELISIPGSVPSADEVQGECPFAARCRWSAPQCTQGSPPLRQVAPGRFSACVRIEEIRGEMQALRQVVELEVIEAAPQRTPSPLIELADVSKVFHVGSQAVRAVDGATLTVAEDESVGLVGESGSGKTTIARMLVGLERASEGQILIDGIDASNWSTLSRHDQRRLRATVQIVFQDPYSSLNPMRTVGSALAEALVIHNSRAKGVRAQVDELLHSVGLPAAYASRKPVALSGGERQRVAIARALAVSPRILICDEPVSALDVSVQAQILNLLAEIRTARGIGYLFITHDLSVVRQIADHIYVMHRGKIVESGHVEDVLGSPRHEYTMALLDSVPRSGDDWLQVSSSRG